MYFLAFFSSGLVLSQAAVTPAPTWPAHPYRQDPTSMVFDFEFKYYIGEQDCMDDVNTLDESAGPRPVDWIPPAWPMNWSSAAPTDGCINVLPVDPANSFYLGGTYSERITCLPGGGEIRSDFYDDWDCNKGRGKVTSTVYTQPGVCVPYYPSSLGFLNIWYKMEWDAPTCTGYPYHSEAPTHSPTTGAASPAAKPIGSGPSTDAVVACPETDIESTTRMAAITLVICMGVLALLLWKTCWLDKEFFEGHIVLPKHTADEGMESLRAVLRENRKSLALPTTAGRRSKRTTAARFPSKSRFSARTGKQHQSPRQKQAVVAVSVGSLKSEPL